MEQDAAFRTASSHNVAAGTPIHQVRVTIQAEIAFALLPAVALYAVGVQYGLYLFCVDAFWINGGIAA